eukprot:m.89761 g.89761  ORF g.89761 m.89761 type:complete len:384 (+) comp13238_c0_seq2:20-1171(+)
MAVVKMLLLLSFVASVVGHGAMVSPRSRNSIDWQEGSVGANETWAWCQNSTGETCNNGQTAYWYSQGCFIGCPTCDHVSGRRQTDLCGKGFVGQLPSYAIAINRNATRDSKYDIYRHNPWRAPGFAPVADACGLAGGTPWGPDVPEEGRYINTTHAHHGMKGSELPEMPTGTVWKAGGEAEVVWQIRFNHGGGYSYRLCPADKKLTEECFQSNHLEFVLGKQALLFSNGTRLPITGVFVNEGTSPPGSIWSRLPLPSSVLGPRCSCDMDNNYKPGNFNCGCRMGEEKDACTTPGNCSSGQCEPCPETAGSDCSRCDNPPPNYPWGRSSFAPPCDEECMAQRPAVLDVVRVPKVPPGKYVVGFRYDCDATAQVWSNCADITIEE